jgi:hypothetical protein
MGTIQEDIVIVVRNLTQAINHASDALEAIADQDSEETAINLRGLLISISMAGENTAAILSDVPEQFRAS